MDIINENSLSLTIDALNDAFFYKKLLAPEDKLEVARWLADRQGKPGSYAGMFAPAEADYREARLFTGEKINSAAATQHILGEESCRALLLLDVPDSDIKDRLFRASVGMVGRMGPTTGFY